MHNSTLVALTIALWMPCAALAQAPAPTPAPTPTPEVKVTSTDRDILAALRAQVTGGAIFFNGAPQLVVTGEGDAATATFRSPQFSQASTYFSFEAQPELFAFGTDTGYRRVTIEPIVNFRMTAIPVSDGTDEKTDTTKAITAPDASFLQSQKAAQVQLGGQIGVHFPGMDMADTLFHWSISLSARRSFASVTDEQRQKRVWDIDDDLFGSNLIGGRLTLYHQSKKKAEGKVWTPGAYIDAGFGWFESFEIASGLTPAARDCLGNRSACLAGTIPSQDEFATDRKRRFYAEARLLLKNLYLGIDINNGAGRDDMRFVGGFTMRLESLFGQ